jgi:soluble lytic murein transglycosylase
MCKKLLLFLIINTLTILNHSVAQDLSIIPLKKPSLTLEEVEQKISLNIIKPLKKPSKIKIEKKIIKKNIKISSKIPKKKPTINAFNTSEAVKISKFYNKRDFDLAKKAIQEMEKANWNSAIKISKKAKDKSIYNFIKWRHLLTTGNQESFFDYKVFIDKNPNYPRIDRLRYLAEHKLSTEKVSPRKIINWFDEKEPLSGYGKMILGESLILSGDKTEGVNLIKEGWVSADLSKNELKYFRKKYKKYLNTNDYIKRADNLAWNADHWDLKRLLRYLPKDYELLYTARHILMTKGYGVDQAIKNVPSKFKNDAGLNYDRLKWRRKKGRLDSSTEILLKIKNDKDYLVRPDKWWKEREIISRKLIYKNKYELAYKISSNHGMSEGPEFAEAEWMSGWIALSFLNNPLLAKDHFKKFYNNVNYPISTSRGAFWIGRSYEKLGNIEQSNSWYEEAANFLTTYYGQLAFLKIYPNGQFELDKPLPIDREYEKKFSKKELFKIVHLLHELKKDKYTKFILRHLANDNIDAGSEQLAAELATSINRYDFAIQVSKIASYQKRFHNRYNYPIMSTPKYINGRKIPESALILSIIRQESEFDLRANSHAGAKGLMQVMPYTAKIVAKQAKLPYSKSKLTSDPEYNINLGSHYIAGLIQQYGGAYPFAIAAYNAGPNRVKYWKKINKDPQKKQINFVDWVELIKFKETRNYVQRVLENYNVYRYVLEQKPINMNDFFKDQPIY